MPLPDLVNSLPPGSVWFAQACCSAGSQAPSAYAHLLAEDTTARSVIDAVAGFGATVASAPSALLSRPNPVRAVIGHVEPTFDWTPKDNLTKQRLTADLIQALSSELHFGTPLGLAFGGYYAGAGQLATEWARQAELFRSTNDPALPRPLSWARLTAFDRAVAGAVGRPHRAAARTDRLAGRPSRGFTHPAAAASGR